MDKDEAYVRGIWELVHRCDGSYHGYPRGTILVQDTRGHWLNFRSEAEAAEFTSERLEQVRQLRRQVSLMKEGLTDWAVEILLSEVGVEMSSDLMNAEYVRDECTGYFVLALLEAELSKLTAGMKGEVK